MNIEIHKDLEKKQIQILSFIKHRGCVTLRNLHCVCLKLIEADPEELQEFYGNSPEYKIAYPLLRLGILEFRRERNLLNNKFKGYVFAPEQQFVKMKNHDGRVFGMNTKIEKYGYDIFHEKSIVRSNYAILQSDPVMLIKKIPNIIDIINYFPIEKDVNLRVKFDPYTYKYETQHCSGPGIYKENDYVYLPTYLKDAKNYIRRIPNINQNIDSINWARLYVNMLNKQIPYRYDKDKNLLELKNQDLPIVLSRALYFFSYNYHLNRLPFYKTKEYPDIPVSSEIELRRILKLRGLNND